MHAAPVPAGDAAAVAGLRGEVRRLQVGELGVAGPEPGELHEVLRVEEQLIHPAERIDAQALRPMDEVVQVLERVLGAVADVVCAEYLARSSVERPASGIR